MGRGKVELKRIENKINRQVTFSKRRAGLLKKAQEISVMCDADVGLIIFSPKGKLSHYATDSCMERVVERYERCAYTGAQQKEPDPDSRGSLTLEHSRLKARLEILQRNYSHYMGDELDDLGMKELQHLEHQLDASLKHVRSRKNQIMNESISVLQKKDKAIQGQNSLIAKKIKEKEEELAAKMTALEQYNSGYSSTSVHVAAQQSHEPNSASRDLTRTVNASETYETPGENSRVVEATLHESGLHDLVIPPWMLHRLD